jgi:hypothetical protein
MCAADPSTLVEDGTSGPELKNPAGDGGVLYVSRRLHWLHQERSRLPDAATGKVRPLATPQTIGIA